MSRDLTRRLSLLEARLWPRLPASAIRSFAVMPWDLLPDAAEDDMVMHVTFVRPTDQVDGEVLRYERTGIHPRDDSPASWNRRLHIGVASHA